MSENFKSAIAFLVLIFILGCVMQFFPSSQDILKNKNNQVTKSFTVYTPSGGHFEINDVTILNYDVRGKTFEGKEVFLVGECYMIEVKGQ